MSRTHKNESPGYTLYYSKEPTWTRRYLLRRHRARCKQLIREGKYEMPRLRGTEGCYFW